MSNRICNQHSRTSSDVTSGPVPNKQKPRNATLSTENNFKKENQGHTIIKHVLHQRYVV